jgi:phage-related protein
MQVRFLRIAELLATHGSSGVGMPHVRSLGNKLWEMRLHDAQGIARALYCAASRQRLVVLHVFSKKTQKTPRRAIEIARQRMKQIEP